jgi:hypothetical protein
MGDSNLHHLGCPNHILKNQVQSGGPELKEKKTKKKVKTVKITVEYLFFTKITSLCFIKKKWIDPDDLIFDPGLRLG